MSTCEYPACAGVREETRSPGHPHYRPTYCFKHQTHGPDSCAVDCCGIREHPGPCDEKAEEELGGTEWLIYIPEEGDWPIDYDGADEEGARAAYLSWAKRKRLPAGAKIWRRDP